MAGFDAELQVKNVAPISVFMLYLIIFFPFVWEVVLGNFSIIRSEIRIVKLFMF